MEERIITLATPVFFALIAIELAWGAWRGRNTYRLDDAINSIGLGVLSQVSGVFTRLLRIGLYAWAFDAIAPWRLPADSAWVWLFALVFYDFCYYWHHRLGHERTILWAAHVVHHQSEDYNLSTALRQTSSGALLGWIFYLPMAAAGVPPEVFAAVALVDLLYQYWIHTQHVGRLGWFDRIFASPSNHRAHHAVNDRYLNRNYGGILIVWDRLFGTYAEEDDADPPVYGTRKPLRSWNPLWANVEVYSWMLHDIVHTRRWRDRLRVLVSRTGWRPDDLRDASPRLPFPLDRPRYAPHASRSAHGYAFVQFALVLAAAVHFLQWHAHATTLEVLAYFAWIALALTTIGWMLEGRRIGAWLEAARNAGTALALLATQSWFGIVPPDSLGPSVVAAAALAGAAWAGWIGIRSSAPPAPQREAPAPVVAGGERS
ncbi:MAG TPA: sterol desaturase family protein [Zeimonas sp.]|nr:sterol desaturase family protein [Zeimonas sp.]